MREESLPKDLESKIEALAEMVHNAWMSARMAEGWKLGPFRDEEAQTSPLLVPYCELPEAEKNVDRESVRATLSGLIAMGANISI